MRSLQKYSRILIRWKNQPIWRLEKYFTSWFSSSSRFCTYFTKVSRFLKVELSFFRSHVNSAFCLIRWKLLQNACQRALKRYLGVYKWRSEKTCKYTGNFEQKFYNSEVFLGDQASSSDVRYSTSVGKRRNKRQ